MREKIIWEDDKMKKICIIWAGSGVWNALQEEYRKLWVVVDGYGRDDIDLRDMQAVEVFAKMIQAKKYDMVIFSAGVWYHKVFSSLSHDEISEQVLVNTLAPTHIVRCLEKPTKFVYLSSVMQYIPAKNMPVYASSKRATTQTLSAMRADKNSPEILSVMLWAIKTQMHIKAGMDKMVGKDLQKVIPKLIYTIDHKQGNRTLFWDWWLMIYIVFPLYKLFLKIK